MGEVYRATLMVGLHTSVCAFNYIVNVRGKIRLSFSKLLNSNRIQYLYET